MKAKGIKTICCECQDVIHDGPLTKDGLMSHGYCRRCADVVLAFVRGSKDEKPEESKD